MHGASRLALPRLPRTFSAAREARAASGSAVVVVEPSAKTLGVEGLRRFMGLSSLEGPWPGIRKGFP